MAAISFGVLLLASLSLMTLANVAAPTSHREFDDSETLDEEAIIAMTYVRPSHLRRQCPTRHTVGNDVAMYACPSTNLDLHSYTCVRYEDLCNGIRDCPKGEDEDINYCMFHKLYEHQQGKVVRELKRIGDQLKDEIRAIGKSAKKLYTTLLSRRSGFDPNRWWKRSLSLKTRGSA